MQTQPNAQPGPLTIPCNEAVMHTHEPQSAVLVDPDADFEYERLTCARCTKWLSDKPLTH